MKIKKAKKFLEDAINDISHPLGKYNNSSEEEKNLNRARADGINDCLYYMNIISFEEWQKNSKKIANS